LNFPEVFVRFRKEYQEEKKSNKKGREKREIVTKCSAPGLASKKKKRLSFEKKGKLIPRGGAKSP